MFALLCLQAHIVLQCPDFHGSFCYKSSEPPQTMLYIANTLQDHVLRNFKYTFLAQMTAFQLYQSLQMDENFTFE